MDCLPTKPDLYRKQIVHDKACVWCGYFKEMNWHVFIECQFARDCWSLLCLWDMLEASILHVEGFKNIIFRVLGSSLRQVVQTFVMMLW